MAVTKVKNDGVDFSEASSIAFDTTTLFVDATNDRVGIGTITPSTALDVTGDVTIGGNLTVNGTTTTINSTTLTVDDLNVVLASGAASAAAADGAGITVDGASASLTYVNSGDKWQFNKAVDVTGTVTADGLTVDGNPVINGTSPQIFLQTSNALHYNWQIAAQENVSGAFEISSGNADADATNDTYTKRLVVLNNGDISFYEDTGTTAAFHWDAADERLGIGTSSPVAGLHITTSTKSLSLASPASGGGGASYIMMGNNDSGGTAGPSMIAAANRALLFGVGDSFSSASGGTFTEYMRIDSSGNVGIGEISPASPLDVHVGTDQNLEVDSNGGELRLSAVNDARNGNPAMRFQATSYKFYGNSGVGPYVAIDSSGDVGIGGVPSYTYRAEIEKNQAGSLLMLHRTGDATMLQSVVQAFQITQSNSQSARLAEIIATGVSNWGGKMTFGTKPANGAPNNSTNDVMILDEAGRVTKPYQPSFKAGRSSNYTANSNADIVFDDVAGSSTHFNTGGHYNTSNGRFTCPVAGKYYFHALVIYSDISDGTGMEDCFGIYINGNRATYSSRRSFYVNGHTGSSGYYVDHSSVILGCAANDYVTIRNATQRVVHGNTRYCYFYGYLLG